MNLITAQIPYPFLEPSLNDAYPVVGNWWDDGLNDVVSVVPGLVDTYRSVNPGGVLANVTPDIRGVDAVSATIQRASAVNEWSNESALGVATDWVITFPTKGFYVDQGDGRQFSVISGDRDEAVYENYAAGTPPVLTQWQVPYPPFAQAFKQQIPDDVTSAKSCNKAKFDRMDREENSISISGAVIPSPAPVLPTENLCYETNVVTFNGESVLGSTTAVDIDTTPLLPAQAGWMQLQLYTDDAANPAATVDLTDNASTPNIQSVAGGLEGWSGLPVIGYMVKQRTFAGNVSKNFASSIDHGYTRCLDANGDGICYNEPQP
jgi:hypothetical protein